MGCWETDAWTLAAELSAIYYTRRRGGTALRGESGMCKCRDHPALAEAESVCFLRFSAFDVKTASSEFWSCLEMTTEFHNREFAGINVSGEGGAEPNQSQWWEDQH